MMYLVNQGKVLNEKKTIEENNIGIDTTVVMSLRLLGEMEKNELMDTQETEEDRDKKGGKKERCGNQVTTRCT